MRCTSTGSGTLPLRKPGILTVLGEVGRGVLDGVLHVGAGHVDGQANLAVAELFDLRLHARPLEQTACSQRAARDLARRRWLYPESDPRAWRNWQTRQV